VVIISSEESSDDEDEEEDDEEETPVPPKTKSVEPEVIVSSDDDGSDEDIPSRIDPVKLLNVNSLRKNQPTAPTIKSEPKVAEDEDEEEDVEMASNHSSSRESRSPVIFNQKPASSMPDLHPLPEAAKGIDDEEAQSNNDSSSSEEEQAQEASEDESESEDEEVEAKTAVQVPKSSPELSRSQSAGKPSTPAMAASQTQKLRKPVPISSPHFPNDLGFNTQDEVDFQLTSSLYEAQSQPSQGVKSSSILPPSGSQPRFGASLQAMNSQKPTFTAINAPKPAVVPQKLPIQEESEEETESSDDESSSDSDAEMANARTDVAAAIQRLGSQAFTQSQDSQQNARAANGRFASQGSSQSRKAGKEFKGNKNSQLLHGYPFGRPSL
jgi:hypothetical protein